MTDSQIDYNLKQDLGPEDDGWLLPDGSLYACKPEEHTQCATWIIEQSGVEVPPTYDRTQHPRSRLERMGALIVRSGLVNHEPSVLVNGQDTFAPTASQLEVIERNKLGLFNTLSGESIDPSAYELASKMMSGLAGELEQTSWYKKKLDRVNEAYSSEQYGPSYSSYLGSELPSEYTPGMYEPHAFRYGWLPGAETESIAHFKASPFEYSVFLGDPRPEDEQMVYDVLSRGFAAGAAFSITSSMEHRGYVRTKTDDYRFRIIPTTEDQCVIVRSQHYRHDGLSQDMIMYHDEVSISVSVMKVDQAKDQIAKTVKHRMWSNSELKLIQKEGNVDLLPDLEGVITQKDQ